MELTRREFDLLEVLARNARVVLSRERLLELVWGYDFAVDTNVVDVFVSQLRRKLEAGGAAAADPHRPGRGLRAERAPAARDAAARPLRARVAAAAALGAVVVAAVVAAVLVVLLGHRQVAALDRRLTR